MKTISALIVALTALAAPRVLAVTNSPPDFDLAFYAGVAAQEGNGIATDSSGNIYVTGQYAGAATIGGASLPAYGSQDYYLASYDATGAARWGVGAGTSSSDYGTTVKVASNGDLVVALNIFTPLNLHGTNVTGFGGRDAAVARYTSAGALLWVKVIGGTSNDSADDLAFDVDGNIILAGRIDGVATAGTNTLGASFQNRHFMVKFASNGDMVWAKTVSNNGSGGSGVAVDGDNNILFTGSGFVGSTNSIFVAKYNSSGTELWQTNHLSSGNGSAIAFDSANNVYVSGTFNSSSITFGSTTLSNPNNALRGFLAKYDSNGNPVWANRIGGRAYRLAVQPDGTAFTCGFFLNTTTNFNDDSITIKGSGTRNGFITRHESDGQLNWVRRVGGANSGEILRSITRDNSGTIHVIGEGTTEAMDIDVATQTGSVIIGRLSTNTLARFTLTTGVSPQFGGVLGISPEHEDGIYLSNSTVQITAYPGGGKAFAGWSNSASGMANPLTVTMDSNKTIIATFTNVPVPSYKLTLTAGAGGSIIADPPSTNGYYDENTVVTLTAVPANTNMVFLNWIGATPSTNNPVTVTMTSFNRSVFAYFSNTAKGDYDFTEIAWTNNVNPGNGALFSSFAAPVIDGSNVVFESGPASGYHGLYNWGGSNITTLVDTTTIAPNTTTNFSWLVDFDYKFVQNGVLYFGATNKSKVWGIYSISNGVLSRVVDSTFNVPGLTNFFTRVRSGRLNNGETGFVGYRSLTNSSVHSSGIYTLKDGVVTKVMDQDSGNLPGGNLPYLSGDTIGLQDEGIAFYAGKGSTSFVTAGIYFKSTNGSVSLIADTNTTVPGVSGKKFTSIIDSVFQEDGKVVFWASFSGGSGFYAANTDGTGLTNLVDTANTVIPGTVSGVFGFFNGGSYRNGRLVFHAYNGGVNGIYIWDHGKVTKVISNLDVLKYGFPINFFILSSQAIQEDGYITFAVRFHNGSTAVYTTLPGTMPRYTLNFTANPVEAGDLYVYPNVMRSNRIPAGTLMTVQGNPLLSQYQFTNFTGSFGVVSTNPLQFIMNSNVTIVANYFDTNTPAVQFTLTTNVSPLGGGSIQLSPDSANGKFASNAVVQLTATAESGKAFAGWSGDVTGSANPINVTMTTDKSVTATFTNIPPPVFVTLTTNVSPAGFGSITVDPSGTTFTSNSVVNLTAVPASGKVFVRWSGANTSTANPISLSLNGNKTITAIFSNAPTYYVLTTSVNPGASGGINVSPAPTVNGYAAGTVVTLTAAPQTGFKFVKWSGASAALTAKISLTMNANKTVTAVFTNLPKFNLNVSLSPTNAGMVLKSPSAISSNDYFSGTVVTLTPVANTGFKFVKWTGSLIGTANPGKVTMNGNKTITAVFAAVPTYVLTPVVNPPGAGDIFANPATLNNTYSSGAVVNLSVQANGTNRFAAWAGGGASGLSNQVNILMNSNKTVTAVFNNDGKLYWQGPGSFISLWFMQNSNFVTSALLTNKAIATAWRLAGTVDFDADGSKDLLFQNNNSGAVMLWMMADNFIVRTQALKKAPLAIKLVGAGDFTTTNSSPSLLWQNKATGALLIYKFDGTNYVGTQNISSTMAPGLAWKAVGVADFNNDGHTDIAFQHTDGRVMLWFMNETTMSSSVVLNNNLKAQIGWKVATLSDIDGNGTPDILFNVAGRKAGVWTMDGTNKLSETFIANGGAMPLGWSLKAGK